MKTHFASPERNTGIKLDNEVQQLRNSKLIESLLFTVQGVVAVLNKHRQIIALNKSYLDFLGIDQPDAVLGLRPGEAVHCIHSGEMPAGCGTSTHCENCGAAVAIVTSLLNGRSVERTCAITVEKNNTFHDVYLKVKANWVQFDGAEYILLFIQDITREQQRAFLERVFFHDVRNTITGLKGYTELVLEDYPKVKECDLKQLHRASERLQREVEMQQFFQGFGETASAIAANIKADKQNIDRWEIIDELSGFFNNHPLSRDKTLQTSIEDTQKTLNTDPVLLVRVLNNMLINAMEASPPGAEILIKAGPSSDRYQFAVWNPGFIPETVAKRIFQRNFSTKASLGRGLGTYSMKLIGEQILGGTVNFRSTREEGTEFRIRLPY